MDPELRILVTNVFGLTSKFGEFQHLIHIHRPDVAIVTETKFTIDKMNLAESSIPGYGELLRLDRTDQGGGIAVWCKSSLAVAPLDILPNLCSDVMWCTLRLQSGSKLAICAVYRPGSCSEADITVLEHLDRCLDQVCPQHNNILLAGNFNVHNEDWLNSTKITCAGEYLEEICAAHGLTQHVDQPTRGANTLDLVISNFGDQVAIQVAAPIGKSDHRTVLANFRQISPRTEPHSPCTVWRYNQADWHRFRHFLHTTNWSEIVSGDSEAFCPALTARILEGMYKFVPCKKLVFRPSDPVWWTPECTNAMSAKQKAWLQTRKDPTNQFLQNAYKERCQRSVLVLEGARRSHLMSVRTKLSQGSLREKAWWMNIKKAGGVSRSADIPILSGPGGSEHVTSKEKADRFGAHFAEKCNLHDNDLTAESIPPFQSCCQSSITTVHFCESTVRQKLQRLDVSKASGPEVYLAGC